MVVWCLSYRQNTSYRTYNWHPSFWPLQKIQHSLASNQPSATKHNNILIAEQSLMMRRTSSPSPFYDVSSISYGIIGAKKAKSKNVRLPLKSIQNRRRIISTQHIRHDNDGIINDDDECGKPQPLLATPCSDHPSSLSTSPDMSLINSVVCTPDTISLSFSSTSLSGLDESNNMVGDSSSTELQDDQPINIWDEGTDNDTGKEEQQFVTKHDHHLEDGTEFWLTNNVFRISVSDDVNIIFHSSLEVFLPDDDDSDDGANGRFIFLEDNDEFSSPKINKHRERRSADRVCVHKLNDIVEKLSPQAGAEDVPLSPSTPVEKLSSCSINFVATQRFISPELAAIRSSPASAEDIHVPPFMSSTLVGKLSPRAGVPVSLSLPSTPRRSNSTDNVCSGKNTSSSSPKDSSFQTVVNRSSFLSKRCHLLQQGAEAEEEELPSRFYSQSKVEDEDSLIAYMRNVSALSHLFP